MIDFFTNNEAFINFVCFFLMMFFVVTWDSVKIMNRKIESFIAIVFGINFGVLTLNVVVNGLIKGF
jgi:hypothetical protein